MAWIDIVAGSFPKGRCEFGLNMIAIPKRPKQGFNEDIILKPSDELLQVQMLDSTQESHLTKAASTGLMGGFLFGGVGLIAGSLMGAADKAKKTVSFTAVFTKNRQFLAKADIKTFEKLQAIAFNNVEKFKVLTSSVSNNATEKMISDLERLVKLKSEGALNESEFELHRQTVLNGNLDNSTMNITAISLSEAPASQAIKPKVKYQKHKEVVETLIGFILLGLIGWFVVHHFF